MPGYSPLSEAVSPEELSSGLLLDELEEDDMLEEVSELPEDEDLSDELPELIDESAELITMLSGTLSESDAALQPAQSSNIGSSAARRFKYFPFILTEPFNMG